MQAQDVSRGTRGKTVEFEGRARDTALFHVEQSPSNGWPASFTIVGIRIDARLSGHARLFHVEHTRHFARQLTVVGSHWHLQGPVVRGEHNWRANVPRETLNQAVFPGRVSQIVMNGEVPRGTCDEKRAPCWQSPQPADHTADSRGLLRGWLSRSLHCFT